MFDTSVFDGLCASERRGLPLQNIRAWFKWHKKRKKKGDDKTGNEKNMVAPRKKVFYCTTGNKAGIVVYCRQRKIASRFRADTRKIFFVTSESLIRNYQRFAVYLVSRESVRRRRSRANTTYRTAA